MGTQVRGGSLSPCTGSGGAQNPRAKQISAVWGLLHPQGREGEFPPAQRGWQLGGQCRWSRVTGIPAFGVYYGSGFGDMVGEHPHPISSRPIPSHLRSHLISFHPIISCPIPSISSCHILSHPHTIHPIAAIPIPIPYLPHHCTACLPKDLEFSLEGHSKAIGYLQALHALCRAWTLHMCPMVPDNPRKVPDGLKSAGTHQQGEAEVLSLQKRQGGCRSRLWYFWERGVVWSRGCGIWGGRNAGSFHSPVGPGMGAACTWKYHQLTLGDGHEQGATLCASPWHSADGPRFVHMFVFPPFPSQTKFQAPWNGVAEGSSAGGVIKLQVLPSLWVPVASLG